MKIITLMVFVFFFISFMSFVGFAADSGEMFISEEYCLNSKDQITQLNRKCVDIEENQYDCVWNTGLGFCSAGIKCCVAFDRVGYDNLVKICKEAGASVMKISNCVSEKITTKMFWIKKNEEICCKVAAILYWPVPGYIGYQSGNLIFSVSSAKTAIKRLPSSSRSGILTARTGNPYYGAYRCTHDHNGFDLYAKGGTDVRAITKGVVTRIIKNFFKGTSAVMIYYPSLKKTVLYGEVSVVKGIYEGKDVYAGQVVAKVKPHSTGSMVHFELYSGRQSKMTSRYRIDPTAFLRNLLSKVRSSSFGYVYENEIISLNDGSDTTEVKYLPEPETNDAVR